MATVLQLVQAGLGLALVAPSTARAETRERLIDVTPDATFTVSLITPATRPAAAANHRLRAVGAPDADRPPSVDAPQAEL